MSTFLTIKKTFNLSTNNDVQMFVSRQTRELSASSNDVVTTMKKHFDYTVDVSFDSAGGTTCTSSTYVLGQQYQNLPTTTRSSYIFQGWYTQLTGGTQISAESTVELSTTTLYAQWKYADVGDDYTEYVVQTTSSYKKTGIYSATRYSSSSPIVVDWGDGNVEAIEGNISQLSHEYSSVGVFHVKISNISDFAASTNNSTWYGTTSQNRYTFKDIVKTGSKCTTMPNAAFYYCSALSSISFLSSCFTGLTSIPPSAFYYCSSITTNLSSLPARIKTLGGSAFRYCTGLTGIQDLRNTSLTSFTNTYIFANCTGVKEFKLPNSIGATAGNYLFYSDSGLSAIQIPSSLTAVPNYMAYGCTHLSNITVPSNIKSINTYSFRGCTNLSSITYETTALTAIGTYAFYNDIALQDLNVPDTVKSIGNYAFYYCYNTHASALVLPLALTSLGTNSYQYCYNLKTLEIPSSLASIGNTAFSGCRSLSSITDYRLTAQTVGANTFGSATGTNNTAYTGYNTYGSNKLYIYSAATGYDSSYWLSTLQDANKCGFNIEYIVEQQPSCTVTLNAGDGSVISASIDYVYGATMSTLPTPTPANGKAFVGWNTASDGSGTMYTTSSTAPSQTSLVLYAIYYTQSNDNFRIVVETTADYKKSGIFSAERDDTSKPVIIDWGDGTIELVNGNITYKVHEYSSVGTFNVVVENIKSYTASTMNNSEWPGTTSQNQYTLKEVIIPSSVTSIRDEAFYKCSSLTSMNIPGHVTSIGKYAFFNCSGLMSMTIPNSVTSVDDSAFRGCSGLTSLIIPNSVTSIGDSVFENCSGLTSATIPDLVTSIGTYVFANCSRLTSMTIPNIVTRITNGMFSGCSGLTSVIIPNSVTSIGQHAFSSCTGLTSMTIPDSVTSIENNAFVSCSSLTSLPIGNGVTTIGDEAFRGCNGLTSVTIPNGVTSIGSSVFTNCAGLISVTIPNSTTSIGEKAFQSCANLTSMTIGNGITSIGQNAFSKSSKLKTMNIDKTVAYVQAMTNYSWSLPRGCTITCTDGSIVI